MAKLVHTKASLGTVQGVQTVGDVVGWFLYRLGITNHGSSPAQPMLSNLHASPSAHFKNFGLANRLFLA